MPIRIIMKEDSKMAIKLLISFEEVKKVIYFINHPSGSYFYILDN